MPRNRSQGIIVALLLGTLALIAYGTLYPFDFKPGAHSISVWQAFLDVSWARSGRGDRIANVLLYVPLGFCFYLWREAHMRRRIAVLMAIAFGVLLSYSIEVVQVFIAQRVSSYWDVLCNGIGSVIGAVAGFAWRELSSRLSTAAPARGGSNATGSLVLILWLAWRLWPFVPQFTIGRLKGAFQPLTDPYFSTIDTLHYLIWWTLLAHIVFALVHGQRGIEALLALIAVVLVACLCITAHGFVPSELLALVLLLPTLLMFNRLTPRPRQLLLLAAYLGLLIYDSLSPFELSRASTRFDLWPFMGWIDAGFPIDWQWLARRACYFAAFVWVLRGAGASLRAAIFLVPLTALGIEIVQMWIPGQSASITEPALALAVAWLVRLIDRPRGATLPRARTR